MYKRQPPELSGLSGPVLGWVGAVDAALDLAPVEYAAKGHSRWQFVLVGPVSDNPRLTYLRELPNVHLLGLSLIHIYPRCGQGRHRNQSR